MKKGKVYTSGRTLITEQKGSEPGAMAVQGALVQSGMHCGVQQTCLQLQSKLKPITIARLFVTVLSGIGVFSQRCSVRRVCVVVGAAL
jgi:hypothetical protein